MKAFGITLAFFGFALSGGALYLLKDGERLRYHHNPFAIQESGYGMLLARLSQDTVNKVWHYGFEEVDPYGHDHDASTCSDPSHNHQPMELLTHESGEGNHADGDEMESAEKSGSESGGHHHAESHEEEHLHEHAHEHGHEHELADEHEHHDHEHHDHDHGDHDHDHGEAAVAEHGLEPLHEAMEFIEEMRHARFERTSNKHLSQAHKMVVARDIEEMLLRAYKMDPSDYGVYSAYFLFLTTHDLRATDRAVEHAKKVSELTISRAFQEDTSPDPWLTAAIAQLNLFFLDQEAYREKGAEVPVERLAEHRDKMGFFLQQYGVLREKAIASGRWENIPQDRREQTEERAGFAMKSFSQFDAMLARANRTEPGKETSGEVATGVEEK